MGKIYNELLLLFEDTQLLGEMIVEEVSRKCP